MAKRDGGGFELSKPGPYLTRMLLFLVLAGFLVVILAPQIETAFMSNPGLNGLILGVLAIGILYAFRQVMSLTDEVRWVNEFRRSDPGLAISSAPKLLAPMATMLGERKGRMTLNTSSMRSILDSLGSRLEEQREISRYMIGLLVFLGLLGTFWGLLTTVTSVAGTIGSLSVESADPAAVFTNLKAGLEGPLQGMGTAFSSSLFGLSGSLVLGFLDLQAGQAQNRFYNELEEWLSTVTSIAHDGELAGAGATERLEAIEKLLEQDGHPSAQALMALAGQVTALTDQMRKEQALLEELTKKLGKTD
ncbi:flagellar motor protein MotA [Parvibaculum sp.]|jgi:hypothetical protein|uniref:flagellar motor protein MotA n=1 Tax=Parvibaculum sp. TaxID=2024848 RepID=UPI000C90FB99|nr:flagellar motor protein MotA [Parvibaculum sp.]MAB14920.1 flagellar motor protein MotA [Parvibaculum sp.]